MKQQTDILEEAQEIIKQSLQIDFTTYTYGQVGFDYEKMMTEHGYSFGKIQEIQRNNSIGNTPLLEMNNINKLVRKTADERSKGAKILIKDEAQNPSGSFKDRRASLSIHQANKLGFEGVVCATSGNFGAAVASQATVRGLKAIVVQEIYDSKKIGQPEILEKSRACQSYGAEVIKQSVGPELFTTFLSVLKETNYFNASLYTPLSILGVETLGYEIATECYEKYGKFPTAVVVTNAGGGNLTGTARGLIRAGATDTKIIAASVDLTGLHMASDEDFNRKSFTTGHTGFGVPFTTNPDRVDVPFSAARPLRYMDRYVLVTQGEVFYTTELLAKAEGLERGPAGNTSLAAAIALAKEMNEEDIIVVQETEYTGAGKHPTAQLTFAMDNGIEVSRGNPQQSIPGESIVIPEHFNQLSVKDIDLSALRQSYVKNKVKEINEPLVEKELIFLAEEINADVTDVKQLINQLGK